MALIGVNILDLHLAVVAGKPSADGNAFELASPVFFGTAFPVVPGLFLTAAHVVGAARATGGSLALFRSGPHEVSGPLPLQLVDEVEIFKGLDLALMKCIGHSHLVPIPPIFEPLGVLQPVTCVGFAVGIDAEYQTYVHRAFAGHVVTRRELYHMKPDQPPGYELSFVTPRGSPARRSSFRSRKGLSSPATSSTGGG